MIKITQIASYIPEKRDSNISLCDRFGVTEDFILNKVGVHKRAIKNPSSKSSDLCVLAYNNLKIKTQDLSNIDCCVVVTQNPDQPIPHVSAIVHGHLELDEDCACFDISLGCSGYVYALNIVSSFMSANSLKKGLLFTSDQYSPIIDPDDKSTLLIFGDAAAVTLLEESDYGLQPIAHDFGSRGKAWSSLHCQDNQLHMNGREVFNFSASTIPKSISKVLEKSRLSINEISKWYLHQGSKYIVDAITSRSNLDPSKVPFKMLEYGNTVSSSIPLLLEEDLKALGNEGYICMSGFGVGLSWATSIYKMKNEGDKK